MFVSASDLVLDRDAATRYLSHYHVETIAEIYSSFSWVAAPIEGMLRTNSSIISILWDVHNTGHLGGALYEIFDGEEIYRTDCFECVVAYIAASFY